MTTEQRINIQFCVELGITATKTLNMLHEVHGDSCMLKARVFKRYKRFVEGRKYDPKKGLLL